MDSMNYAQDFGYTRRGWLNTLTFPLEGVVELVSNQDDAAFEFQKTSELQPIFGWLIPLVVLAAGLILHASLGVALLFYALEALLLALLSRFYLKFESWLNVIELALNVWVSFLLWSLIFLVFFALISIFLV